MGIWSNFKTWLDCKRTGRMDEYQHYKRMIEHKQDDIKRFEQYIENTKERLEYLKQHGYSENSSEYKYAQEQLQRWRYELDATNLQIQFLRPNTKEDIEYRQNNTGDEFVNKLRGVISPELNLVFHGTPVYFAKEILKSGKITSSADRYDGYIKSTDMSGEISVSDIDSLPRTLDFFSGMASYQHCLPGGCIFAMYPKDDKDFDKKASIMSNVDFRKNPEQLYGIFTTPENIPNVQKWLDEIGLDPYLVYDFEGFIKAVQKTSRGFESNKKLENSIGVSQDIIQAVEERSHGPAEIKENLSTELENDREENQ